MSTSNKIEGKGSDYSNVIANSGKIWDRTDNESALVKAVVEYTSEENPAYAVKTFTTS